MYMTNSKNIPEEFYTAQEVADMLKVNIMTIYRYINSGKLNAYKFGKEFRIEKDVWREFLNDNKFN
jgi:excisionase family DNA binding protein